MYKIKNTIAQKIIIFWMTAIAIVGLGFACSEYSFAAINPVTVKVPLTVSKTENGDRIKEKFSFKMAPLTAGAPAPESNVISCGFLEEQHFSITFDKVGKFQYRVTQIVGNDKNIKEYDERVYIVDVLVYFKADNSIGTVCTINEEGADYKPDKLLFKNTVKAPKGKGIKTGDEMALIPWIIVCITATSFVSIFAFLKIRKYRRRAVN